MAIYFRTKFCKNIFYSFEVTEQNFIPKKFKGMLCDKKCNWSFIFVPSLVKIFSTVFKLQSGHDFHTKVSKGHNSIKENLSSYSLHIV